MSHVNIGYDFNEKLNSVLYYQLCPYCKKPIVGIYSYPIGGEFFIPIEEYDNKIKLLK